MKPLIAFFALCLMIGALCGCASAPQPLPERVLVPVPVECPRPEVPPRPQLPISELKEGAPSADVARAYAATVEALKGYAKQLEALLTPNTQPSTPDSR